MIVRGYDVTGFVIWIVTHAIIIVTGFMALRKSQSA